MTPTTTPTPTPSLVKSSLYDSDYDSESDFVASENQPLATGFDFCEKNRAFLGRSEPEFAVSLLPCHFTMIMKER